MKKQAVAPLPVAAMIERLNAVYASHADSPTHRAIFREVYGADYPEEVVPPQWDTPSRRSYDRLSQNRL